MISVVLIIVIILILIGLVYLVDNRCGKCDTVERLTMCPAIKQSFTTQYTSGSGYRSDPSYLPDKEVEIECTEIGGPYRSVSSVSQNMGSFGLITETFAKYISRTTTSPSS